MTRAYCWDGSARQLRTLSGGCGCCRGWLSSGCLSAMLSAMLRGTNGDITGDMAGDTETPIPLNPQPHTQTPLSTGSRACRQHSHRAGERRHSACEGGGRGTAFGHHCSNPGLWGPIRRLRPALSGSQRTPRSEAHIQALSEAHIGALRRISAYWYNAPQYVLSTLSRLSRAYSALLSPMPGGRGRSEPKPGDPATGVAGTPTSEPNIIYQNPPGCPGCLKVQPVPTTVRFEPSAALRPLLTGGRAAEGVSSACC